MFTTESSKSFQRTLQVAGSYLLLAAAVAAAGCSGGSKPAPPPISSTSNSVPFTASLPPEGINVSEADTSLLQKSVARVLGFTDVGDIALTLYQDTESALFDSLSAQAATPDGSRPDPIFYHSPVFVAGQPKLLPLPDGRINVTIPNRYTQQAVREIISEKMADALAAYKIRLERIGLIPHDASKLKVTINAFGEVISDDSDAQIDYEFRNIIFNIHESKVPKLVIDAMAAGSSDPTKDAGSIFLEYIGSINIEYAYFVQQYGTSECKLNISDNDLRDLYVDQEGCPEGPSQEEIDKGLEWVQTNKPSAAQTVNSQLQSLLTAGRVVTVCAAASEARKLQAKASVSCTTGGTREGDQDGANGLSPIVRSILESSIKPQLESQLASLNAAEWDDAMMAAVIKMFGSPETYMSVVNNINSEVKSKTVDQLDNNYYTQTMDFYDTLRNHDVFTQASEYEDDYKRQYSGQSEVKPTKGGGGGFNVGIGGFGFGVGGSGPSGGGGNSEVTDEFKRNYNEFHNLARTVSLSRDVAKQEDINAVREFLYNMDFDHDISSVNGEFKIIPKINLAVKAAVDRDEAFGQIAKSTDLGKIVQEQENFPVQLTDPADAELVVQLKCTNNPAVSWTSISFPITQFKWWQSSKFWNDLSDRASNSVFAGGCNFLGVRMFYQNAVANAGDLPSIVYLTVYGLTESKDPTSGQVISTERSLPISVELRRGNIDNKPVEGSIQIDPGEAEFTKVKITN